MNVLLQFSLPPLKFHIHKMHKIILYSLRPKSNRRVHLENPATEAERENPK